MSEEAFIDALPDEVLEYILSLIPPYKDLHHCMLVSKRWRRCVLNVVRTKQRNLYKAINDFDIKWEQSSANQSSITKRYSHTAVVHENSMFVFGGCTCHMTTFNDLWRLDLSTRQWVRPLAKGTYPSPKACSSLVRYKDSLVLFGGWAYPPSYPLYQSWHLFDELHVYDIPENRWRCVVTAHTPPPTAGHSASVIGDWMIVMGGLQKTAQAVHTERTNDVWKLHMRDWTWHKQPVEDGPKPSVRFGQTQVVVDEKNLLILGGSGGPTLHYCDAWLLNMNGDVWKWKKVEIEGKNHEPRNIWSNPGCKIGDKVMVLNRIRNSDGGRPIAYYPKTTWGEGGGGGGRQPAAAAAEDRRTARIDMAQRRPDVDENVNGRRGTLRRRWAPQQEEGEEGRSRSSEGVKIKGLNNSSGMNMAAFNGPDFSRQQESEKMREKRLARLLKVEENLTKGAYKREKKTHYLGMYLLDISNVLSDRPIVTWLPPNNLKNGPEEAMLYTLVEGNSELIMFGGIKNDSGSLGFSVDLSSQISNTLHFITAPSYVI
ncbi:unnamed protein product [Acanthoscelides obtectus]|uniref:F-box domain-containing protein n=1 Tax=Acanthoscelides obtectus TaxID=200917 RepID=A0A9P0PKT5_ACAOB|nr:unnamed protein product [Acanthoscelides obtectus]CAK1672502.1 F-box only protein 42 [Acanthoscelides obtectus]